MAKRELIEKEYVKDVLGDTINSEGDYRHALRLIDGATIITEQDIVKPYLEAIRAEEIKYSGTGEGVIQAYADGLFKAIEIINNLLSEQEGNG